MKGKICIKKNTAYLLVVLLMIAGALIFNNQVNKGSLSTKSRASTPPIIRCLKPEFDQINNRVKFKFYSNPDTTQTLGVYRYDVISGDYYLLRIYRRDLKKSVERFAYSLSRLNEGVYSFFYLQPDMPSFNLDDVSPNQRQIGDFSDILRDDIRAAVEDCLTIDFKKD